MRKSSVVWMEVSGVGSVVSGLEAVFVTVGLDVTVRSLVLGLVTLAVGLREVGFLVEDLAAGRLAGDFLGAVFGVLAAGFLAILEEGAFLARLIVRPSIDLFESIVYNYSMKATKITKKQQAVLDFLEDFTEENGYSPSYREIQAGLGLSSVSAVAEHIDNMVSKGILRKVPGAARSLEVLDFRHTETVELFRARFLDCSEEERDILLKAAEVLGLELGEE